MTTTTCVICDAPTDAFLCTRDARRLEKTIAELPAGLRDLETTATRQAKITAMGRVTVDTEQLAAAEHEQRRIPAFLRSKQDRGALVANPLPLNLDAANLHSQAVNGITTWARHLGETRDPAFTLDTVLGDARGHAAITRLCVWLLECIDAIRLDEAAGPMFTRLTDLTAWIAYAVDRKDADVFAGRCESIVMRTVDTSGDGPVELLTPTAEVCGTDLMAREGDAKVTCPECGSTYEMTERRAKLDAAKPNAEATPKVIANGLSTSERPVNASTVRTWIGRDAKAMEKIRSGPVCDQCTHPSCRSLRSAWTALAKQLHGRPLIHRRGWNRDGESVYRAGDVQDRIEWSERQRSGRMAS